MMPEPITLVVVLASLGLIPLLVMVTTSFLKLSVVIMLVRNALGVQQIPPNMALYGLALILTAYIMAPVASSMWNSVEREPDALHSLNNLVKALHTGSEPLKAFMRKNADAAQTQFFLRSVKRLWPVEMADQVLPDDFLILMPAFMVSELHDAFEIGFLLFLPFVVIDLVVSNILVSMGMMMVSPITISLPLKLFLFVMVDGWTRLIQGLVATYV